MPPLRISRTSFNARHRRLNRQLLDFSITKRGRNIVTAQIKENVQLAAGLSLKAINYAARIRFAQHLVDRLLAVVGQDSAMHILFVTLILEEHAVPFRDAADFDVAACKIASKEFLYGFDYFGFVEPAFFYRAPFVTGRTQPYVSWHSHAIVWTKTKRGLAKKRQSFNRAHRAFIPGWRAAHLRAISLSQLPSYARYMSKNVVKQYTAYPKMKELVDPQTGEIIKRPTGKWRNRKEDIKPTNLVRALTAVGNRTLRQLSFAGGSGKAVRLGALNASVKSLRRDYAARDAQMKKLLFGS